MALNGDARTQAIIAAITTQTRKDPVTGQDMVDGSGNPVKLLSSLNASEKTQLTAQIQAIFGTDTNYLTSNAVVLPGSMVTPAGAAVSAPPYAGTVTSPSPTITGTGKLS